jgi:hypothetical protein
VQIFSFKEAFFYLKVYALTCMCVILLYMVHITISLLEFHHAYWRHPKRSRTSLSVLVLANQEAARIEVIRIMTQHLPPSHTSRHKKIKRCPSAPPPPGLNLSKNWNVNQHLFHLTLGYKSQVQTCPRHFCRTHCPVNSYQLRLAIVKQVSPHSKVESLKGIVAYKVI